jgi:hypothetical protein
MSIVTTVDPVPFVLPYLCRPLGRVQPHSFSPLGRVTSYFDSVPLSVSVRTVPASISL